MKRLCSIILTFTIFATFTGTLLRADDDALLGSELDLVPGMTANVKTAIEKHYNSGSPSVMDAYALILKGHNLRRKIDSGEKGILIPEYEIPVYNTALAIAAEIFKSYNISDNDTLPLSMGIANSILITFGDTAVRSAALDKCVKYYRFLIETAAIQSGKGLPLLTGYPLEAQVALCILWSADLSGPAWMKDEKAKSEIFGSIYKKPAGIGRFNWCTIKIDNLYRLRDYFVKTGHFSSDPGENIKSVLAFLYREDRWIYPIRPSMDKAGRDEMYKNGKAEEMTYMTFDGITCKNANWNNPNYAIEQQLAEKKYYGWCTDIRQSSQFVAASLGIAAVHTGGGIWIGKNEYSHYFSIYYLPRMNVWIRDTHDSLYSPGNIDMPILLKRMPADLGTYWKDGNEVYYIKGLKPAELAGFYDAGIPSKVMREITFTNATLTRSQVTDMSRDTDMDGIPDYTESALSLNIKSPDTDGDGYSDMWEVVSGYNPSDKASPGRIDYLVLDGVRDTPASEYTVTVNDPAGDMEGGNDIKTLTCYCSGGKLYLQAEFYARKKPDSMHTIKIRNSKGHNWWIQGKPAQRLNTKEGPYEWYNLWEYPDFQETSKWVKSTLPPEAVRFHDSGLFEASIDISSMDTGDSFQVSYVAGGNGKSSWYSDQTLQTTMYLHKPAVAIDGVADDMRLKVKMKKIEDQANDVKADSNKFDLKELYAGREGGSVYLCTEFFNNIESNSESYVTFHLQCLESETNYWVQFSGTTLVFVAYFKNGTDFKDWENITKETERINGIFMSRAGEIEAVIPSNLFRENEFSGPMRVRVYLGGIKKGKEDWAAEESDFVEF